MPRLPISLILKARAKNPLLAPLLRTCRDLASANNELRWLTEHVRTSLSSQNASLDNSTRRNIEQNLLRALCHERGQGKPLQYLLGTEYFGDLELVCRPGVLIPRPETADIASELVQRLKSAIDLGHISTHLKILDLCTGTGCIALLLHSELRKTSAKRQIPTTTLGVDISPRAVETSLINKRRLGFSEDNNLDFVLADIRVQQSETNASTVSKASTKPFRSLEDILKEQERSQQWDVVVANPPYISPNAFRTASVEKSVRLFEPRLALVPPNEQAAADKYPTLDTSADIFYPRILDIAEQFGAKVVLLEVGGREQALRVKGEVGRRSVWGAAEIWDDGISAGQISKALQSRAVVCWRKEARDWICCKPK